MLEFNSESNSSIQPARSAINLLKRGGLSGAAGQRSLVLSVWRGLRLGEVIEGRL
jgi:hypothetical protein